MQILLIVDGSQTAVRNTRILSCFNFPQEAAFTAVPFEFREQARRNNAVSEALKEALDKLGLAPGLLPDVLQEEEELLALVHETGYDLVVDLRRRRRSTIFRLRTFGSRLTQEMETSLLLAHPAPSSLRKVLLCSGGEEPSEQTIRIAAGWLRYTRAEIHLMHVMSQVVLDVAHPSVDLQVDARNAINSDTREGIHLKRGMQWLRDAGVTGEIIPVLRHGLVLEEITAELREGDYDLVVVGAHIRTGNRLLNLLLEDITDKLISRIQVPFLITRIHPDEPEQLRQEG